jgi:hypothetical protein
MAQNYQNMLQSLAKLAPQLQRQDAAKRVCIRKERDKELDGLASLPYHERITEFARNSTRHWVKDCNTVIDFRPLYAVTIHQLQRQLAQEIQIFSATDMTNEQLEKIRVLIQQYSKTFYLAAIEGS